MNTQSTLKQLAPKPKKITRIEGAIRTISLCLDPATDEFLNVGIMFHDTEYNSLAVQMLDHLERIRCLYDKRIDLAELTYVIEDIERLIYRQNGDVSNGMMGPYVKFSTPRYAAGKDEQSIITTFFESTVTLARQHDRTKSIFRYKTTPGLRKEIFKQLKLDLGLQADQIIHEDRFPINLNNGQTIDVDIPLIGVSRASGITSAWYSNHLMVSNEILSAYSDINLLRQSTGIQQASIAILRPSTSSGMTKKNFLQVDKVIDKQLKRLTATGIEVIQSDSIEALGHQTASWWKSIA